jgi:hypothetical protein
MRRIAQRLAGLGLVLLFAAPAAANEFTDVIDAFDRQNDDPFDLNLSIGYERYQRGGKIVREDYVSTPHDWDFYATRKYAEYVQVTHLLNMELDIGLFRDISLRARVPLILSDNRELKADGPGWRSTDAELFNIPFKAPERSGLDYIAVGLWWGILDQGRDDTKPNWTVFAEGRFGVGEELAAACEKTGTQDCKDLTYSDGTGFNTKGGISRGLNELAFGFRLSRRYGIVDPYYGIEALLGWSKGGSNYYIDNNSAGQINTNPPMVGTMDFGLEIIPWDVPEQHRKLVIGLGAGGKYHSEGREVTPLFDALGTSRHFHEQEYVDFNGNEEPDTDIGEAAAVSRWTGMTDVENYATFFGQIFVMIQPAKYVKFRVGFEGSHESEHFITKTDQCPAGEVAQGTDGECGVYNWGHRPEIDMPGHRFRFEDSFIWSIYFDATAQF